MTSQNRLFCSPRDILAIRFICKKCESIFSVPAKNWKRFSYVCNNCGARVDAEHVGEEKNLQALNRVLEQLFEMENDRFAVEFELRNP